MVRSTVSCFRLSRLLDGLLRTTQEYDVRPTREAHCLGHDSNCIFVLTLRDRSRGHSICQSVEHIGAWVLPVRHRCHDQGSSSPCPLVGRVVDQKLGLFVCCSQLKNLDFWSAGDVEPPHLGSPRPNEQVAVAHAGSDLQLSVTLWCAQLGSQIVAASRPNLSLEFGQLYCFLFCPLECTLVRVLEIESQDRRGGCTSSRL